MVGDDALAPRDVTTKPDAPAVINRRACHHDSGIEFCHAQVAAAISGERISVIALLARIDMAIATDGRRRLENTRSAAAIAQLKIDVNAHID